MINKTRHPEKVNHQDNISPAKPSWIRVDLVLTKTLYQPKIY